MSDLDLNALIDHMVKRASETYTSPRERAALRCGIGDAVAVIDLLVRQWMTVQKRPTKLDQAVYETLSTTADLIWNMREKIEVPNVN